MTAAASWSDRRSGRVASTASSAEVTGDGADAKAPESMAFSRTTPFAAAEGRGRRVSRRQFHRVRHALSVRDQAILTSLGHLRFLTTSQLRTLHFPQHATEPAAARICRRVLGRLAEQRIVEHLERRIGGLRAGSESYVWRVGPVGDRLLRDAQGEAPRGRRKEPSLRHLDHTLAIADCYLALVEASRAERLELVAFATEPTCWRTYHGTGGARETLKPDLYAVTASGDYEDHWFIEVDRATESLPTLLKKCTQYERYRRTGQAQADGGVFPRVLWVMPDETRGRRLEAALRANRQLDEVLFRTTTGAAFIATVLGGAT